jgi:predicted RNA-binding Zn-ribbon protein involved in translation (DUF1610 family)
MVDAEVWNAKEKGSGGSKCPSCGANLSFDPETQSLKCEHCGTTVEIKKDRISENNINSLFRVDESYSKENFVFQCKNCGAKQIVTDKTIAQVCNFCGTSNVVSTDELPGLKPQGVVPFKITEAKASDIAVHWGSHKFFAPKAFKRSLSTIDNIKKVFLPSFTFDANTFSTYHGRLGKYYTVSKVVNGKTVTERKIRYFNISGSYVLDFDDVLVKASNIIDQKAFGKIQPFNTNGSLVYNSDLVLGSQAVQYDKDGKICFNEAQNYMRQRIQQCILKEYVYDVVDSFHLDAQFNNVTYKYVLLPLHVGHYNYKEKLYNFFVSGETGNIFGKTPLSFGRVLLVVLGILVAVGLVGLIVLQYL